MPVLVVKPQPFSSFMALLTLNWSMIRSKAISGMRLAKSALSLLASKSLPGASPILANLASAGLSSSLSRCASPRVQAKIEAIELVEVSRPLWCSR